jgi:hypothetical protein
MSNKTNFKPKLIGKDKANRFKLIKGALHQEEITIINISTLNIDAPNFIKHCWTFCISTMSRMKQKSEK